MATRHPSKPEGTAEHSRELQNQSRFTTFIAKNWLMTAGLWLAQFSVIVQDLERLRPNIDDPTNAGTLQESRG